jgi:MinD-like ATPase involved in chromosome partitioning or flagellar assembly
MAVTGGKGGVGKTSVALNLALALARQDYRVLLLDGDTDLANVTIMLGQYPQRTLENVLTGECTLASAIFEAPHGLHILPGASGVERCMDVTAEERLELLRALAALEKQYDYILIDTAAGIRSNVIHMIASAALACVVVTPDPTSLTDAFSLIKVLRRRGYRRTPSILINMAAGASQARSIFERFRAAVQRHIGISPHYLGAIWRDETLRQAVATQRPVALMPLADPSCRQFLSLAERVQLRLDQIEPRTAGFAAYWNHVAKRRQPPAPVDKSVRDNLVRTAANPATNAGESAAPDETERRWQDWRIELKLLLSNSETTAIQRYEAISHCLSQVGQRMDEDTVETLQTGLTAMEWEALPEDQRRQFAAHLRHLADQVEPVVAAPSSSSLPASKNADGPRYDPHSFGNQNALLHAIKEAPDNISLDDFLDSLTRKK